MSDSAKNATLKALLDSVIVELMIKTTGDQVYLDENTTVAAKIAEIVTAINARAKTTEVESMISELKQEMLGDTPVEAYNTFTELAAYISEHQEAADALTAAIGNKADKSTVTAIQETLNGLGSLATKSTVSESDLDAALKEKLNSGSSSDSDHTHSNQTVLDGITADKVAEWDSKTKVVVADTQPEDMTGVLWFDISN